MIQPRRRRLVIGLLGGCLSVAAWARGAGADEKALARQILETSGVRGGLVVHLGCGDGRLTAALRASASYLVQGLDTDPATVGKAREHIRSLGLYGPVTAERWDGKRLPYIDNMVTLLVAAAPVAVPQEEVMRVLAPNGVACVREGASWKKAVKPRPKETDEWTHYLYDASGNAVSHDTVVGPPRRLQWTGSPRWARHHDRMASMSCMVSANGRLFYIMDHGPIASVNLPPVWELVARDAYNGTVLWRRPIATWNTHLWPLKSGPGQIPRRLVAVGDRVFVTLTLDAPCSALDAATGQTVRDFKETKNCEEIIASEGVLFLLVNDKPCKWADFRPKATYVWDNTGRANREWAWDEQPRRIVAVEADSGKVLWTKQTRVAPLTLAADKERVAFHDGEKVVALNRATGAELWVSAPVKRRTPMPVSFGPTLVLTRDVVLFSGGDRSMSGLSAKDGKTLWTAKHPSSGHASPEDLLVVGGLAWAGQIAGGGDSGVFTGRDLLTGEVKSEFPPDIKTYWFHHRCYRSKATDNYLIPSRTGIEFVDFRQKHWDINHWVRSGCIYGMLPCNGLVYASPQSCGCYLESKLYGFAALAPASAAASQPDADVSRLERGPAFSAPDNRQPTTDNPADWPTYRHDPARSGAAKVAVPAELKLAWATEIGGKLSSVVVAEGKLLVASVDDHTVHALDAATGKAAWTFTAGGRVDSPPTVWQGRVLFGSADGWVYCLRASDGALAWRFRAGPRDLRIGAFEQLESLWPVSGSVLVQNSVASFVAGRSMFLDGGLRLIRLDAATGRKLSEAVLDERDPATGGSLQVHVKGLDMPVALPDVLSSDGKFLYMRSQRLDLEGKRLEVPPRPATDQVGEGAHLFSSIGFLDDSWFHRGYWLYGRSFTSGWGGWFRAARYAPYGRILVVGDDAVYGYGRKPEFLANADVLEYRLFAAAKAADSAAMNRVNAAVRRIDTTSPRRNANAADWKARSRFPDADLTAMSTRWVHNQPSVVARAMVLADGTLFVAGPPDVVDERRAIRLPDEKDVQEGLAQQAAALAGKLGARLWAVSAADGKPVARYKLDAVPVHDGMAAAGGKLFLATLDGKVICLAGDGAKALPRADDEPVQTAADEPALPKVVTKEKDFDRVAGCAVFESKLGYRLQGQGKDIVGLALNKLKAPLTKKAVLKAKVKAAPDDGGYLLNGFIAFGDGPQDPKLVKCGVRIRAKTANIIQGPLKDFTGPVEKLDITGNELFELTVTVDLEAQKVVFKVLDKTMEAKLEQPLKAITHVGLCIDNALVDASPVEVSGE
ncbi:MAG TPA: PQQ-binding-like beta-propeller repeat protein [Planctomycetota bacterium]|nr:PQQ-binding-like beta-propeller repeat protein [Planctomycetota bacterium]